MKVLLTYIDFNKTFDIHIDASKFQLCVFISQNDKLILVYSRKLNPAKTRYTTTKKKLFTTVETLNILKHILIG